MCDNDEQCALELEVDEEGNVVGTLFAPRQLSKDEEAPPALSLFCDSHTLTDGGKWFEVAFRHTAGPEDTQGAEPAVQEKDIGYDDGDGKDPFGYLKRDLGLDLTRPVIEGEQVHCGEGIGGVNSTRDNDEDPQPGIGEWCKTRGRLEVAEVLHRSVGGLVFVYQSTHDVVPFLLIRHNESLLAISTAPHDWCCVILIGGRYVMARSTVFACSPAGVIKSVLGATST